MNGFWNFMAGAIVATSIGIAFATGLYIGANMEEKEVHLDDIEEETVEEN